MKKLLIFVIVLATSLGFSSAALADEVQAVLRWQQQVDLSTLVSGQIAEVLVDVGSRVEKDQPLLRLDSRGFRAEVSKAEAAVIKAREVLEEAGRELERGEELFDRTVISIHELQLIKIAHTRAQAEYQDAQAGLDLARLNLEYSVVRAPYHALVLRRQAEPGQTVVTRLQSTPLLTVVRADRMVARAAVEAGQLQRLSLGQELGLRVLGASYQGHIQSLGLEPLGDSAGAPRYAVDVEFALPEDVILRAGQSATLMVP